MEAAIRHWLDSLDRTLWLSQLMSCVWGEICLSGVKVYPFFKPLFQHRLAGILEPIQHKKILVKRKQQLSCQVLDFVQCFDSVMLCLPVMS